MEALKLRYNYAVCKDSLFSDEMGYYETYGIQCCNNGSEKVLITISDISCDYNLVNELADDFTAYQLNPIHIYEAVENSAFV